MSVDFRVDVSDFVFCVNQHGKFFHGKAPFGGFFLYYSKKHLDLKCILWYIKCKIWDWRSL